MKTASDLQRYFLAIIPPEPAFSKAHALKLHFKELYNSKASLNSPPHITLHMPFLWKEKKEQTLIDSLQRFTSTQKSFAITLRNFEAFAPRVIYIDVEPNPALQQFQKELERFCKKSFQLFNANRLDLPFHPHLTLAFRDLKKEMFAQAWAEFKIRNYEHTFITDKIALLKHDGKVWHIQALCALSHNGSLQVPKSI